MNYEVTPKEQLLRYAIVTACVGAIPIAPLDLLGIHAALTLFIVLTSISGGIVAAFYLIWLFGGFMEGFSAQLIGDNYDIPRIYWPFGSYQRRIRRERRIRQLELECGIRDPWPL